MINENTISDNTSGTKSNSDNNLAIYPKSPPNYNRKNSLTYGRKRQTTDIIDPKYILASRTYKVGVIIMDPTNTYTLIVKQKSTGYWWFPKGSIESFDTISEAKREVLEETGLMIDIDNETQKIEIDHLKFTTYIITHEICNVVPKDSDEIEDIRWININNLSEYYTNNVFNAIWDKATIFINRNRPIQKQQRQSYKTICNNCKKAHVLYMDQKSKYEDLLLKHKSQLKILKRIIGVTELLKKENDELKSNISFDSDDDSIMTINDDFLYNDNLNINLDED